MTFPRAGAVLVLSTAKSGVDKRLKTGSKFEALGYSDVAEVIEHHNSTPSYLLKRSEQALTAMYLERCRAAGLRLTLSQLQVLVAIEASPSIHQAVAARMSGMDEPTTALVVGSLDKAGFVSRKSSSLDKRQRILQTTVKGRLVQKLALQQLSKATEAFLSPIGVQERRQLIVLLHKISTNPQSLAPPLCNREGSRVASPDYVPVKVLPAFLISRCLQVAVSLVGPAVAPYGLSIRQYVALFVLATFEDCDLSQLSRALGATRSSLAHILAALEERSLVRIRRAQSSRSLAIGLTPIGFDLLLSARPAAEAADGQIIADLEKSAGNKFITLLARVLKGHRKLMSRDDPSEGREFVSR